MTARRAAQRGRRSTGRSVGFGIALLVGVLAGCSTAATPVPSPTEASVAPSGSAQVNPEATAWPGGVVDAIVALGAADPQFDQVGKDLSAAVNTNDMQTLLGVTTNVEKFLTANQQYIPHLQGYAETKDLGDKLAAAYAQMLGGITKIHDSLVAGDGAGVTSGFDAFAAGSALYGDSRATLGDFFNQAIFMKRHYNL
jgi:hypothetical protein